MANNTVNGIIYDEFNVPMINVTVQAYDKDLRSAQLLGAAATDVNGFYTISYDIKDYVGSDYKTADIFIRVLNANGVLLGESPVNFNVPAEFVLDFKIGNTPIKGLNEFDALVQKIKLLTVPQQVDIADLQETDKFKDISFLAHETGEDATKIAFLPIAFTLSRSGGQIIIPEAVLYGLFRLQFPTTLNALSLIKSDSIADGIKTAVSENIISARWGDQAQIDSIVQRLNALARSAILSGSDDQSKAFKQVIAAALPEPQQKTFVAVYLANEKTPEKFWESLSQQTGFTDPKVIDGIQTVLKLNLLTNSVPALTTLLYNEQKQNPALKEIRGFASFTYDDWHTRITQLVSTGDLKTFPAGIEGNTPEEKTVNYATAITKLVESLHLTGVFANRLSKDTSNAFKNAKTDLTTFFANNIDYDLKNNNIHKLFDKSNLTGIAPANRPRLKQELVAINLLYKITDDYPQVSALRLDGLDSATALVNKYSPARFSEKFAASMSPETAAAIYKKAQQIDNRATALAMSIKMRNDIPVYAINGSTNDAPQDYVSLFGDTNCDCEHCQSVYSPSAYFVDILHLIMKYHSDAYNQLTTRRPDLIHILLTCKNTNTPLPYIDLVNELLEYAIAPIPPYPHYQTTNSAEELLAYPEHVHTAAYNLLKTATSAFNLPLNLPLEETRLFLDKLGVKRYRLMELYRGKQTNSQYDDLPIAAEYLQLSQEELKIVNGTTPMPVNLGRVTDFLRDTGLTYREMLQLLECYFINPLAGGQRSIKIVSTDPDDQATCKIELLKLQTTSPQSLKVNPFIRLWKKTGWDIFDLDRAFTALGVTNFTGNMNKKLIIPLSHIARLKAQYKLSVRDSIALWSNIDIAVYYDHSLEGQPKISTQYEKLFQNKQVTNPVDPVFSNPGGLSGTLVAKSGVITAALNLSQKDFDTLNQPRFVNGNLTLQNLSVLFRYAMLAKALKLSVDEVISAIDLSGINPFGINLQSSDTLAFIDTIAFIRSSGFSIPELNGLLRNDPAVLQPVDMNTIAKVLTALREGLKKIELPDPLGTTPEEQAKNKLQNQNSFIADTLGTAFKTESKVINVLINNLVKSAADSTRPAITPFIDAAGFIASEGPLFTIDSSGVITWAFPDLFNTYVLLSHTWDRISKLVSKLKISNDEFIYFQGNEGALGISGIWNLPVPSSDSNLFPAFENLSDIIRFRNALASPTTDWFTLFDFAILHNVDAKKNFIHSLAGLSTLTPATIEFLLGAATNVNDTGILKFAFPSDYLNGAAMIEVINCANMADTLGSSADNIAKLTIPTPTDEQENIAAAIAKSILKSKYDVTTWLSIITPLSNQLRLKKRDALTSYMLTSPETGMASFRQNNKITDTNSLYAHFLIDLEMDACMITSRIKQAISSMQLFVDRCLMNLEAEIVLGADFTTQWDTWRKRYRVWEANRKIFLYPENWIDPDLRDDKSPFFKELESKLRQNEITDETAEDALRDYLEKLDAVSNLEMIGVYPDTLTGIVHAIGRTRNIPHQYFYTKQINKIWSAWEKIDLDIEGDHVLPVVWNNRLMLFWVTFTEKQEESGGRSTISDTGGGNMSLSTAPAPKYWEMKLAWSEYKGGKWSGKKISKDVIPSHTDPLPIPKDSFTLSSYIDAEKLYIRLHVDWLSTDNIIEIGGFVFDGCQNSPSIYPSDTFPDAKFLQKLQNTDLNGMFIKESSLKDSFSVYKSGIYKKNIPMDGYRETTIFHNTPGHFQILPNHHEIEKVKKHYFFYRNERNNFYVHALGGFTIPPLNDVTVLTQGVLLNRKAMGPLSLSKLPLADTPGKEVIFGGEFSTFPPVFIEKHYAFQTFYHPYVCELIKTLNTSGIEGLYKNAILDTDGAFKDGIQNRVATAIFIPQGAYDPTAVVQKPYPVEQVDFNYSGVYSIYNWELFFHIPLLIATRLSQNQKFDEARKWFHYIFDPTRSSSSDSSDASDTKRFWITKPFKEEIEKGILSIEDLLNTASPDLDLQLNTWEQNPFNPHALARLRPFAYMLATVMEYIKNLIAWGDQLFQQDTIETINEATLLYILAANTLGKKRERVPARAIPEENSFSTIQGKLDSFSNAKVAIQSFFSLSDFGNDAGSDSSVLMPLFCIPKNDILLGYWDTVADRLFKIRHCLNIEGVFRQLPLFEPPINPALLVKATAAGLDLSSILNDMNVPLPNYRFPVLLQKANELCNDVKGLGNELLAALEKRDAEHLSLLRSGHELNMLNAVRDIKVLQRDEAKENLDSLNKSKDVIQARRDYYASRTFTNASEQLYFRKTKLAASYQALSSYHDFLASAAYTIPDQKIGSGFTLGATFGGTNIGEMLHATAQYFSLGANCLTSDASQANILGGYQRRQDDWKFQAQSAELELKQIDKQIAAGEIRLAIAEKELENHDLQREQSKEVDDFLKSKFTNEELYNYMVQQISSVYFQSYQLAYNMAKKVQKCFEHELGIDNASFIQFGYWDSLKKGLLAGEKLMNDLRRMEAEYLNRNRREFEITKHISLAQMAPLSLITLKETGKCNIYLYEWWFDMDYPGHYMRRIKNVSISIPCVVGPYTGVNCTLSLSSSEIRMDSTLLNDTYEKQDDDVRFKTMFVAISSIATSNAQNDSGMFGLNFNDERYLPFEGAGVISNWKINMPIENNYFDFASLSDVILHISYTSRDGGDPLTKAAKTALQDALPNQTARLFSLKHEFPNELYKFLNPEGGNEQELVVTLKPEHFPFFIRGKLSTLLIKKMDLFVESTVEGNFTSNIKVTNAAVLNGLSVARKGKETFNNVHHLDKEFAAGTRPNSLGEIRVKIKVSTAADFKSLTSDQIDNMFMLFQLGS